MHPDRSLNLTARAGLIVVAETLMALGLEAVVRRELRLKKRQRGLSESDKLQAIVLLLAAGGERIEDVRLLREDQALARLLERTHSLVAQRAQAKGLDLIIANRVGPDAAFDRDYGPAGRGPRLGGASGAPLSTTTTSPPPRPSASPA